VKTVVSSVSSWLRRAPLVLVAFPPFQLLFCLDVMVLWPQQVFLPIFRVLLVLQLVSYQDEMELWSVCLDGGFFLFWRCFTVFCWLLSFFFDWFSAATGWNLDWRCLNVLFRCNLDSFFSCSI
jgi:hypothetical protein